VGVVDHHAGVVAVGELDDLLERRDVPVHREHAVRDDQAPPPVGLAQAPGEVLGVAVVVDEHVGAGEPAAVDDAGVVQLVGENDISLACERLHHAGVGQVARAEQHAALAALEVGELLLQPAVDGHVSRHEPRRPGADAPAHGGVGRRLAHARMVGKAEIVVRAQQEDGLAVEEHAGALRP
jgi:hypothetical protein